MAAVCFPTITKQVIVKPGIKVYHQIVEQFGDLKNRGLRRVTERSPSIEDTKNNEVIKTDTSEVSEDLEPTVVVQESMPEEPKDVVLGVEESESKEVQRIDEDMGQSDLSDSDMYTTHSRK